MTDSQTLGELIDQLFTLREERRELDETMKEVKARYDEVERKTIEALQATGLDKASGEAATVSLSEIIVPSVTDWTKLMRWIQREKAFHMFERRISKSAWAEAVEQRNNRPIPGVESFTKINLNMRTR